MMGSGAGASLLAAVKGAGSTHAVFPVCPDILLRTVIVSVRTGPLADGRRCWGISAIAVFGFGNLIRKGAGRYMSARVYVAGKWICQKSTAATLRDYLENARSDINNSPVAESSLSRNHRAIWVAFCRLNQRRPY